MFFQASEFGSYGLIEGFMWGLASSLESLQARVVGLPSIIICFPAKLSIHHFVFHHVVAWSLPASSLFQGFRTWHPSGSILSYWLFPSVTSVWVYGLPFVVQLQSV